MYRNHLAVFFFTYKYYENHITSVLNMLFIVISRLIMASCSSKACFNMAIAVVWIGLQCDTTFHIISNVLIVYIYKSLFKIFSMVLGIYRIAKHAVKFHLNVNFISIENRFQSHLSLSADLASTSLQTHCRIEQNFVFS